MARFGRWSLGAAAAAALALSSCAVPPPDRDPAAAAGGETSGSEATSTPAEAAVVEVAPDYTRPNPMGQDVDAVVAQLTADVPDVTGYFSDTELHDATMFALNWLEQATAVESLYDEGRSIPADDLTALLQFWKAVAPEYRQDTLNHLNTLGAVKAFPVPNNDGTVSANQEDGSEVDIPYFFDGPPDISWQQVTPTAGPSPEGKLVVQYGILAEYGTVDESGDPFPLTVQYQIAVVPSTLNEGEWELWGWEWQLVPE